MAYVHLNAREWLEAKRVEGCEWAPELLEIIDGTDDAIADAEALDELFERAPDIIGGSGESGGSKLERHDRTRLVEWIFERLDLLDALEQKIDEASEGMTFGNGTWPMDAAEKLEAMLNSGRWLDYDL